MNRLSTHKRKRILRLWFEGMPRDEIARTINASGSTVTAIVKEFEATAHTHSLDGAGLSYGIQDQIKDLRALSKEIRKSGATIPEAVEGAKLLSSLAKLNVTLNQLNGFIQFSKTLQHPKYKPNEFVQKAVELSELEEKTGKSYTEIVIEHETKSREIKSLGTKINDLENEIRSLGKERRQAYQKNQLTKREIAYAKKLKEDLSSYGVKLSQAEELKTYLDDVQRLGADPQKAIEYIRKAGSLEKEIEQLHEQQQGKEKTVTMLEGQRKSLQDQLTTMEERVRDLRLEEAKLASQFQGLRSNIIQLLDIQEQGRDLAEALRIRKKELQDSEEKIKANEQRDAEILRSISILLEVEAKGKAIVKAFEDRSGQLQRLQQEISLREQALDNVRQEEARLQTDLNLAKTIITFLTKSGQVSDWKISELQEKVTWIAKVRRGEAPMLKCYEAQMTEEAKRRLAETCLPLIEKDLVPKWEHEKISTKLKSALEENERLKKSKNEVENLMKALENLFKKPDEMTNEQKNLLQPFIKRITAAEEEKIKTIRDFELQISTLVGALKGLIKPASETVKP